METYLGEILTQHATETTEEGDEIITPDVPIAEPVPVDVPIDTIPDEPPVEPLSIETMPDPEFPAPYEGEDEDGEGV